MSKEVERAIRELRHMVKLNEQIIQRTQKLLERVRQENKKSGKHK